MLSLSINNRHAWEHWPEKRRAHYRSLYGTYSAGVCKPDEPPCAYYVMIRDPLARMMSEYATRERLGCRISTESERILSPPLSGITTAA